MMAALRTLIVLLMTLAWAACPTTRAEAASVNATVQASVVKPLQLTSVQGLDFGQILLGTLTADTNVSISQAGALSCPAPLVCSGAPTAAIFNVTGSNGRVVTVIASASDLTNGTGDTLRFVPVAPQSVTLPNSGNKGLDFAVGGTLTLTPATVGGNYSGTMEVTVDYQ